MRTQPTLDLATARRLALLDALLDASRDGVFSVDEDGVVTSWNRSAERILGWAPGEVIGEPMVACFPAQTHSTLQRLLGIVASGDHIERLEVEVERKGGMPTPVALTLSPILDDQRQVVGAAVITRDVTEERLAQAALAEMEARLQEGEALAHVGRWLWDIGSGAVQWSEEVHRIHGVDPWDFGADLDAHVAAIVGEDRERIVGELRDAVATGCRLETEYDIVRPDGEVRHVYSRSEPAIGVNGTVVGLRGVVQDLSAIPRG